MSETIGQKPTEVWEDSSEYREAHVRWWQTDHDTLVKFEHSKEFSDARYDYRQRVNENMWEKSDKLREERDKEFVEGMEKVK